MDRKVLTFNILSLLSVFTIFLFYTGGYLPQTLDTSYRLVNLSVDFNLNSRRPDDSEALHIPERTHLETSSPIEGAQCIRQNNFVFAKVHKCGSSTIQAIFFHYAYDHKLIVALPKKVRRAWIGTPRNIYSTAYVPPPGGKQWNIFNHHNVHDKDMFLRLMPSDTKFVTILREPVSRISSAFNYFHMHKYFTGMSEAVVKRRIPPIKIFMSDPWYWHKQYRPPLKSGAGSIHDFGCIRNCIAHDLGLEENHTETDVVNRYVVKLTDDFTTVMVLEKLDESLVLLKRRMCWSLRDIIYRKGTRIKRRPYKFTNGTVKLKGDDLKTNFTHDMLNNFKKYSAADFTIYNHFRQKLENEIVNEGQGFLEEVAQFKHILDQVSGYCRNRNKPKKLLLEKSTWNERFSIDLNFCKLLRKERPGWAYLLRRHYYDNVTSKL